jgi:uncharacterized protein YmfQ (DUF2313 family)
MTLPITPKQTIFIADSLNEVQQRFANYMPGGKLFESKNICDSNFRQLINTLAYELFRLETKVQEVADQIFISDTVEYINEWEELVGIPDDCFKPQSDSPIELRRKWVIAKLVLMRVLTEADWVFLAKYLGFDIDIVPVDEESAIPSIIPTLIISSKKFAAFTVIVKVKDTSTVSDTIPSPIPTLIGRSPADFLECIFNKIKPANVNLIFELVPQVSGHILLESGGKILLENGGAILLE